MPLAAIASDGLDQLPFYEAEQADISAPIEIVSPIFGERQQTEWQSTGESTAQSTPFAPVEHEKFPHEADVTIDEEECSKTPTEKVAEETAETTSESAIETQALQEAAIEKIAPKVTHIQCRTLYIDGTDYLEIPVGAERMQCGFFCLKTNREDGITKLKEYMNTHPVAKELIANEIFRNFRIGEFFFLIDDEEDLHTKPAVARIHELQEKMTDENRQENENKIVQIENILKEVASLYVDKYLTIFQKLPVMLMVERNVGEESANLFDLVAAAHGYALEVYIQETRTEDGMIDPAKLTLYHSFNPSKVGLEGDFQNLKLVLTNFDRNPIDAERSKTEWRNHFNRLLPL
ncbi:MAG: hypothetical protein CNLJKLNK_00904 [Holosporales bacterium]